MNEPSTMHDAQEASGQASGDAAADVKHEARGWGSPLLARKAHYFVNGISLCGGWIYVGKLYDTMHDHKDNCAGCMRKRALTSSQGTSPENAQAKLTEPKP